MSNIPYIQLKELCTVNQGLQIPISKRFKSNGDNRYFYITVQFLKDSYNEKYYVKNPPKSSICNEDDIIVVRTGSTGKILTGIKGCFHNNFFKVNYNKEKVVGKYLYYCLKSREKQKEMKNRSGITTIPDLNHFMFLDMKIPLPSYSDQIGIVKTLDSINSQIEINNKINTELEAMAKTLYDYWFVQFDFPNKEGKPYKASGGKMVFNEALKREIPEGWDDGTILNCADLLGGGTPKKEINEYWNGEIPFFTPTDTENNVFCLKTTLYTNDLGISKSSTKLFDKGTILITARGTVGKINIAGKPMAMNQSCYALKPKTNFGTEFIYFHTNQIVNYLKAKSSGSIFKAIVTNDFKFTPTIVPNVEVVKLYSKKTTSMFNTILNNKKQNQKLSELRDWLLPMLMNGQVSVVENSLDKE